jgi:hypothetical protein
MYPLHVDMGLRRDQPQLVPQSLLFVIALPFRASARHVRVSHATHGAQHIHAVLKAPAVCIARLTKPEAHLQHSTMRCSIARCVAA